MKKIFKLILLLTLLLIISNCSSIKVIDSWHSKTTNTFKNNTILVIARAQNKQARIAFEKEMANQMRENGMNATESFKKFPKLLPDEKLTEEKLIELEVLLKNEGFNGVVVTVVKNTRESTQTTESGGYTVGTSYFPDYYAGFYNYYINPMSYSSYGSYVPSPYTTKTTKTFILETVAYDLEQPEEKQLISLVTSEIKNVEDMTKNAYEYANKITRSLTEK